MADRSKKQGSGLTRTAGRVTTADQTLGRAANACLAIRLAAARRARGLEAAELDLLIGARPGTIQRIEDEGEPCPAADLYRIGRVLNRPLTFFFADIPEDEPGGESAPDPYIEAENRQLNAAFATLESPAHRKAVLEFVQAMSERRFKRDPLKN